MTVAVALLVQVVLTKKGPNDDTVKRLTECGLTKGKMNQVNLKACADAPYNRCLDNADADVD